MVEKENKQMKKHLECQSSRGKELADVERLCCCPTRHKGVMGTGE